MSTIVNKTALGTDTGTGQTYDAYEMEGQTAKFQELSPVAQASYLSFKRVEAKPTKDYVGAKRGEVKFRREYADSLGKLWPAIVTMSSSLPAFLTDAQRAAIVLEALLLVRTTTAQDNLSKLAVPQS